MKTKLILLAVLVSLPSQAAPLTFQFDSMIDTTAFGGASATPLSVTYTFDSASPEGSGPFSGPGSYGPLTMQIRVGSETVSASGGGIFLWNHIDSDGYDVRPSDSMFSGQLFGRDITNFRFLLVDQDATMFSSTALPLSPQFATFADFQQTEMSFADGSALAIEEFPETPLGQRTPFTLMQVPEPSTLALLSIGVLVISSRLAFRRSRREC